MRHVTFFFLGDIFVSFVHQLKTTITLLSRRAYSCNVLQLKTHSGIKLVRNGHIPFFQTLFWGTFHLCNLYVHMDIVSFLYIQCSSYIYARTIIFNILLKILWNLLECSFSFLHPQSNVLMFQCKARPICFQMHVNSLLLPPLNVITHIAIS